MSNTMHIHKKHVVKYASSGQFNWGMDKLHNLLDATQITYSVVNEDCPEYDENFSIPKDEIKEGIEALTAIDQKKECKLDIDVDDLSDALDAASYTLYEWRDTLQWMLDNSDPNCDDVFVEFF